MLTYCNLFKTKNHQVLNNIVTNEHNEIELENTQESYKYEELFNFLTNDEFLVMFELLVNKNKKNEISKKMNISLFRLNKIEKSARGKIFKMYGV